MKTDKQAVPFKWPFPATGRAPAAPQRKQEKNRPAAPLRKAMVADVVMVIFWGASIPGLMWLGAAGGF